MNAGHQAASTCERTETLAALCRGDVSITRLQTTLNKILVLAYAYLKHALIANYRLFYGENKE